MEEVQLMVRGGRKKVSSLVYPCIQQKDRRTAASGSILIL